MTARPPNDEESEHLEQALWDVVNIYQSRGVPAEDIVAILQMIVGQITDDAVYKAGG
jgi:non-ribosomal peptide synthetase component F